MRRIFARTVPQPTTLEEPSANYISTPPHRPRLMGRVWSIPGPMRRCLRGLLNLCRCCCQKRGNSSAKKSDPAELSRGTVYSAPNAVSSCRSTSTMHTAPTAASWYESTSTMYTAPTASKCCDSTSTMYTVPTTPSCCESSMYTVPAGASEYVSSCSSMYSAPLPACDVATINTTVVREPVPLTLENLTFHQCLGKGSFGTVMLTSHPSSDQQLAVKIASKRRLSYSRAYTEREALYTLDSSPFFTHLHATLQTQNNFYFVMEYVGGEDLHKFIYNRPRLDTATVRFISAEILCGLHFMHSKGIVHRDLKPGNILLDSVGHVKIADFGLAATGMFGESTCNLCIGTPSYRAPEVIQGIPYNFVADYFSFGIIVYVMALKKYPFKKKGTAREMDNSVCHDIPWFPTYADPIVKDFIDKLLVKNPQTRLNMITNLLDHPFFLDIDWVALKSGKVCPPFAIKVLPVKDPLVSLINKLDPSLYRDIDWVGPENIRAGPPFAMKMRPLINHPHNVQSPMAFDNEFSFVSDRWMEICKEKS